MNNDLNVGIASAGALEGRGGAPGVVFFPLISCREERRI